MENNINFTTTQKETLDKLSTKLKEYNSKVYNFDYASKIVEILLDLKMDYDTILCGYLYTLLKDEKINLDDIKEEYSEQVFNMISSAVKIESINIRNKETQAEIVKSMFIALAKDISCL